MTTGNTTPFATLVQVTIASYPDYGEAEAAVNRLAGQGFPVERVTIVGSGLRSVEQVEARVTAQRAALAGAVAGLLLGGLLGLVLGVATSQLDSAAGFLYVVGICTLFGALAGAVMYLWASGGRRDFISVTRMEAARYDVQVDEAVAGEARRLLARAITQDM